MTPRNLAQSPPPTGRQLRPLDRLLLRLQPAPPHAVAAVERRRSAALMRVNHAGEIAAQALYHGQALVARDPALRRHLLTAAAEERNHLRWCAQRLAELGDRPSRLGALWYVGSFAVGALAGLAGDSASLGFVEETEAQVAAHLDDHLRRLPPADARSRELLELMKHDEQRHGAQAHAAGARPLPPPVRRLMSMAAGMMKFTAYRI
ncbi:MAG: 2-polyprenyl-3-methyl-6-methoxy-1,4-benzoquinone monooxygenase [Gammaproteobacteria bacterium]|nr:2-polyprenyl-3-methyl-6-methoxy-1,4-benzoquinone monooxygenase [Gammaproteobacteria bacterium]